MFALSGIRVCDPELLAIGMTLPGVVDRGRVIARLPSLSLLTLAGMIGPGHSCTYFEVEDVKGLNPLPEGLGVCLFNASSKNTV